MTDLIFLHLLAGNGGNGKISFRREKYIPKGGPDGGDGGDGGNIIIRGIAGETTLRAYAGKTMFQAKSGEMGGGRNSFGKKAEDLVLEVPLGTVIWQLTENQVAHQRRLLTGGFEPLKREQTDRPLFVIEKEGLPTPLRDPDEVFEPDILYDISEKRFEPEKSKYVKLVEITEEGQEYLICQGGFGGKGNELYKNATDRAPLKAQYGSFGEERIIALELRLLADVGLVGFPNAGKSTLLSVVTKARPKIASYPFTTLEPYLGIMHEPNSGRELVLADIPGLIEGASEGKGLGFEFLRHIKNCSALLYVLSLEETQVFDESLSDQKKAELLFEQYTVLRRELETFDPSLLEKRCILSVSKIDIYNTELIDVIRSYFEQKSHNLMFFSSATSSGLTELQQALIKMAQ
jgi:GTP-binding protein